MVNAIVSAFLNMLDVVNGVASCSNDFFNNQLMRKEWGLDGFVVSGAWDLLDTVFTCRLHMMQAATDCGEIRGLSSMPNHGTSAHPYTKQVNATMACQAG